MRVSSGVENGCDKQRGGGERDERGVVAPVVVVVLVVLVGAAAMVVDYGNMWQHRRQMVTTTDAAALAAAQDYALGVNGCAGAAVDYFGSNAPGAAAMTDCAPSGNQGQGSVKVDGSVQVEFGFGRLLGLDDAPITSSTTASWLQPISVTGLRPIGLCLAALADLGQSPPTSGAEVKIPWEFTQPDLCTLEGGDNDDGGNGKGGGGKGGGGKGGGGNDNIPGGWGFLDLDNNNEGGGKQLGDRIENGYDGEVSVGGTYISEQGATVGPASSAIDVLVASGECVSLPVYDIAIGPPNEFRIVDFATGVFTAVDFTGAQANRSFTIRFQPCIVQGEGGGGGVDYGPKVLRICDVDNGNGSCP